MPLTAAMPPQPVPIVSKFDYVTVDPQRRRVYAAHTGSEALTIVDADSGKVLGQVKVGPLHGVAVNPASGHVYTGNGEAATVSEVDPQTQTVVRSADVGGFVDAVIYDPANHHIYAAEDDGTRIFVIDSASFKVIGTVALPGHKPEYLAVDPVTHDVYQNIANLGEFVVVDGTTLKVKKVVATPDITGNHPLQYDPATHHVLVGGQNGVFAAYDRDGTLIGKTTIQNRVDQCSLDPTTHLIACAGSGTITVLRDNPGGAPTVVAQSAAAAGVSTVAIDSKSGNIFVVWAAPNGDFVQAFALKP